MFQAVSSKRLHRFACVIYRLKELLYGPSQGEFILRAQYAPSQMLATALVVPLL